MFANYPGLNWKFSISKRLDNVKLPKDLLYKIRTIQT